MKYSLEEIDFIREYLKYKDTIIEPTNYSYIYNDDTYYLRKEAYIKELEEKVRTTMSAEVAIPDLLDNLEKELKERELSLETEIKKAKEEDSKNTLYSFTRCHWELNMFRRRLYDEKCYKDSAVVKNGEELTIELLNSRSDFATPLMELREVTSKPSDFWEDKAKNGNTAYKIKQLKDLIIKCKELCLRRK